MKLRIVGGKDTNKGKVMWKDMLPENKDKMIIFHKFVRELVKEDYSVDETLEILLKGVLDICDSHQIKYSYLDELLFWTKEEYKDLVLYHEKDEETA